MRETSHTAPAEKDRRAVNPGEPGCHIVTAFENGQPTCEGPPLALAPSGSSLAAPSLIPEQTQPEPAGLTHNDKIAHYRASLVLAFKETLSRRSGSKRRLVNQFVKGFNTGSVLSEIHKELGPVSPRTLYRWTKDFDEGGIDGLVPRYGGIGNTKVTDHEKNFLLTLLLHPHRLKVSYAIALTKEWLKGKGIESPSSPATLRRFADQFKKEHYDLWVLRREGEKALNDKVLPYAERDWRVLDVGDGLVADGHRLNFQVINPNTGKPCRPALILFWDWRSSYPLGWEIMLEENIQCVASALRNAILALGKIPKWVYLDNGKAFKAKIFTEDLDFEDGELPGMFSRLNINYHFAQPYNAQAKPIERIFGILNEQLERLVHSYIGNSIDDKPAWTKRNEKLARSLHGPDKTPTIPEANALIRAWRDRYAEQPSRGRDGLRPIDIFNEGKGSGVDPAELVYLMMAQEIRTVHRNGVTWLGWHWYHEDLYGLKDRVVIRYSLSDLSQIYIFHQSLPNGFCVAEPIEQVNPMASESESPRDMEAVKEVLRLKKKVKSGTCRLSDLLETKAASQIDWSRTRTPEIAETIQKIEDAKKPKAVNISPFVEGVDYSNQPETRPKYKPPRQWDGYYEHWERYNHHLKQDPATITDEDREFIAMYKGTSEYQAIYCTKPTQLLSGGGKIEYRPTIEDPLPEEPNEKSLIVDPRTGLSRPDDGTVYKDEFLYWEWYRSIEEKFPGVLKDTDWAKIEEYQGSPEWEKLYGGRGYARMVRTAGGLSHASLEPKNKEGRI